MKINLRESLGRLDLETDNRYDLRNHYDSSKLSDFTKNRLAEALNEKASAEKINRILNENFAISVFSRDSEEYEKLEKVADYLTNYSPNNIYYRVEKTYFDFGQDWMWTTIIAYDKKGNSWQAIYPKVQEDILLSDSDEELEEIAKKFLRESRLDKGFSEAYEPEDDRTEEEIYQDWLDAGAIPNYDEEPPFESLKEASYGGAYDIEDDMYFTKEELVEFADEFIEKFSDWSEHRCDLEDLYMDSPKHLVVDVYDSDDGVTHRAEVDIDMRKIRTPKSIYKYGDSLLKQWKDSYLEYHEYDESLNEAINAKDSMVAQEFNYTMSYGDQSSDVSAAVIVIPNGLKINGELADLTVYAEDENGEVINFRSVDEANDWINKYKDDVEFHVEHGNELHATPSAYYNLFDESLTEAKKVGSNKLSQGMNLPGKNFEFVKVVDGVVSSKDRYECRIYSRELDSNYKTYGFYQGEVIFSEDYDPQLIDSVFPDEGTEVKLAIYRVPEDDPDHDWTGDYFVDYIDETNESLSEDYEDDVDNWQYLDTDQDYKKKKDYFGDIETVDEQLYKIVLKSGPSSHDFVTALSEEDAEEIIEYYGGRWYDENGFEWDMYLEEDDESTERVYPFDESLEEKLIPAPQEVVDELLSILDSFGFVLDDSLSHPIGKTWSGNTHIQVINKDSHIEETEEPDTYAERLMDYVPDEMENEIDALSEREKVRITYNFGINRNWQVTGGLDVWEKYVPGKQDESLDKETLEYDDEMSDTWADLFDVASPQEVADNFRKDVKSKDKIYKPNKNESLNEAYEYLYDEPFLKTFDDFVSKVSGLKADELDDEVWNEYFHEYQVYNEKYKIKDFENKLRKSLEEKGLEVISIEPSEAATLVTVKFDGVEKKFRFRFRLFDVNEETEEYYIHYIVSMISGYFTKDESLQEGFEDYLYRHGVQPEDIQDDQDYDVYWNKFYNDLELEREKEENLDEQINLPGYAVRYITGYAGNGVNNSETEWFRTEEERDRRVKELEDKNYIGIKTWKMDNFYHTLPKEESLNESSEPTEEDWNDFYKLEEDISEIMHSLDSDQDDAQANMYHDDYDGSIKITYRFVCSVDKKSSKKTIAKIEKALENYLENSKFSEYISIDIYPKNSDIVPPNIKEYEITIKAETEPQEGFGESLKEDIEDYVDVEEYSDFDDDVVEEGTNFIEDGTEWVWVERIAGPIHLDFDNWAVWAAREYVDPRDFITIHDDGKGYDFDGDGFKKKAMAAPINYFVVDEDTGFIDWGPVETQTEAQDFLNGKVEDWEKDESLQESKELKEWYTHTLHYEDIGDGREYDYEVDHEDLLDYILEIAIDEDDAPEDAEEYMSWVEDNFDKLFKKYEYNILNHFEEDASQEEYDKRYEPYE